jgi:hypothetical protein
MKPGKDLLIHVLRLHLERVRRQRDLLADHLQALYEHADANQRRRMRRFTLAKGRRA